MTVADYQLEQPTAQARGLPFTEFATGWFHAGWSAEFEKGKAYPLRYFF